MMGISTCKVMQFFSDNCNYEYVGTYTYLLVIARHTGN